MFAFECVLAGCSLTVAVRKADIPAANILKDEIKEKLDKYIEVMNITDVCESYSLIINGTPVGMFPKTDTCILPEEIIKKADAVFDAVYNPTETLLRNEYNKFYKICKRGRAEIFKRAFHACVAGRCGRGNLERRYIYRRRYTKGD